MYEKIEVNSERWFNLELLPNEKFRDIKGFEGLYQISNYGRIKSLERYVKHFNGHKICDRYIKSIILKCFYDKDGYLIVNIHKEGKCYWKRVHQIMGIVFLNNDGSLVVNHKDLNKQNSRLDNLELCTAYENTLHAIKNGAVRKGRKLMVYNDDKKIIYNNLKTFAQKNNLNEGQARYYIYKKKKWGDFYFKFLNSDNFMI